MKEIGEINWHVAVATQRGHELMARVELHKAGVRVHVPIRYEPVKIRHGHQIVGFDPKRTGSLPLSPYFFVRFRTSYDKEHALVLAQRGVKAVLVANGKPAVIASSVIATHLGDEYCAQYNAIRRREKQQSLLPLMVPYRILRGPGEGVIGDLLVVDHGTAHIAAENGFLWKPSVLDIMQVSTSAKARAA